MDFHGRGAAAAGIAADRRVESASGIRRCLNAERAQRRKSQNQGSLSQEFLEHFEASKGSC